MKEVMAETTVAPLWFSDTVLTAVDGQTGVGAAGIVPSWNHDGAVVTETLLLLWEHTPRNKTCILPVRCTWRVM